MGKLLSAQFKSVSPYVTMFGIFVAVSLILQCFVPFLQRMAEIKPETFAWILVLVNQNFHLPVDMISNFWAAISATYVGLDRAAFTFEAFKCGSKTHAFDEEKMSKLNHVMWLSFIIYTLAVLLYTFFDAELALTPLFVSFGSCVLCYVAGNKAVTALQNMSPADEVKELDPSSSEM